MQVEFAPYLVPAGFQAIKNALLNARRLPGQNLAGTDCIHHNRGRPIAVFVPLRQAFRGIAFCLQVGLLCGPASPAGPAARQWLYIGHGGPETGVGAGLRLPG